MVTYTLAVKAVPGASKSAISGWLGEELKIRVAAPPEKGRANSAVLKLLATELGIGIKSLCITRGQSSAHKIIEIQGLSRRNIVQLVGEPDISSKTRGRGADQV